MALKALVPKDKAGELPEAHKSLYTENEQGDFVLEVDGALDVFAPGLVAKNKELIGKLKVSDQKKAELEAKYAGIDLEKYQSLIEAAETEADKGNGNGDAAKALAEFQQKEKLWTADQKKLTGQVEELTKKATGLEQKYHSTLVTNEILKAIEELDGNAEMLLPAIVLAGKVKVNAEEDKETVRVLDADGVVLVGDTKGTPMSVKQYIETEFKSKTNWAGAFKADGKGGSGAQQSNKTTRGIDMSKMSPTERLKVAHRT
jgi:hypothetical protein